MYVLEYSGILLLHQVYFLKLLMFKLWHSMNGLLLNLLLVSEMLFTYRDSYFGLDYLPTYVHIV